MFFFANDIRENCKKAPEKDLENKAIYGEYVYLYNDKWECT